MLFSGTAPIEVSSVLLLTSSRDRTFLRLPGCTYFVTIPPLQYAYCMKLPRDLYCTPQVYTCKCTPGSVYYTPILVYVVGDIAVNIYCNNTSILSQCAVREYHHSLLHYQHSQTGGESCVMWLYCVTVIYVTMYMYVYLHAYMHVRLFHKSDMYVSLLLYVYIHICTLISICVSFCL